MSDFDKYIEHGDLEPRANEWQTAIDLQDVDGLKVSDYPIENHKKDYIVKND